MVWPICLKTAWQNDERKAPWHRNRDCVCHCAFIFSSGKSFFKKIGQKFWSEVSVLRSLLSCEINICYHRAHSIITCNIFSYTSSYNNPEAGCIRCSIVTILREFLAQQSFLPALRKSYRIDSETAKIHQELNPKLNLNPTQNTFLFLCWTERVGSVWPRGFFCAHCFLFAPKLLW